MTDETHETSSQARPGSAAGPPASPVVADQSEVATFLADPATHGLAGPVHRIETHGAVVFLAGDVAYKMKRAVRFPFMDFSTLALRQAACEAEIAVNGPNAPALYQAAIPVCRQGGMLRLGGPGEPVEWLVRMARFDETRTLDHVAAAGPLDDALLSRIVAAVRASHDRAPRREADVGVALERYVRQNDEAFRGLPALFPPAEVEVLTERALAVLAGLRPLLRARAEAGYVRRCHGDLHLRNIVLVEGEPLLFDAIEFDEEIATCDVLYDLAFLDMDLWERGQEAAANRVLNRYAWETDPVARPGELEGLAAFPFFFSLRAALRAKIEAAEGALALSEAKSRHEAAARRYFALAGQALAPSTPALVAVGGLSGTGKSTLAAGLAPRLGPPPGALHWRSDVERKHLLRVPETERLPRETYTPESSEAVYGRLMGRVADTLRAGFPAIVDAVFARPREREALASLAARLSASFHGLWLEAPSEVLRARVAARLFDASDATLDVVAGQARYDVGPIAWPRLDASAPRQDVLEDACRLLGLSTPTGPEDRP